MIADKLFVDLVLAVDGGLTLGSSYANEHTFAWEQRKKQRIECIAASKGSMPLLAPLSKAAIDTLVDRSLETNPELPDSVRFVHGLAATQLRAISHLFLHGKKVRGFEYFITDAWMMHYRTFVVHPFRCDVVNEYLDANDLPGIEVRPTEDPMAHGAFTVMHYPAIQGHAIISKLRSNTTLSRDQRDALIDYVESLVRVMDYVRTTCDNEDHRVWRDLGSIFLLCLGVLLDSPVVCVEDLSYWRNDERIAWPAMALGMLVPSSDEFLDWPGVRAAFDEFQKDPRNAWVRV